MRWAGMLDAKRSPDPQKTGEVLLNILGRIWLFGRGPDMGSMFHASKEDWKPISLSS